MAGYLRQATASQARALGPFVSDSDFKTTQTALTIANTDIKLVVNGAASANKNAGGGTHRVNGVYGVTFDATDTATVGELEVSVVVSGALPVFDKFTVVEETVYDALFVASAPGYLQPTTAGRTLDVSAGGEAGVDWANVGSPTTSLALTGTTIAVTQKVDVDTIKTNPVVNAGTITFPTTATLASTTNLTAGTLTTVTTATNVTTVNGLAAGVITATSLAADAITAAKIADGAIDAATFASGAITAAAIAADAIGASELAADAVTEIQSGLSTLTAAGIRTAVGLASANLDTQLDALPTATENADALLKRDWTAVTGEAARCVLNALRFLRNKWAISGTTLTVTSEDDATTAWSATLTTAASADPVTGVDPS